MVGTSILRSWNSHWNNFGDDSPSSSMMGLVKTSQVIQQSSVFFSPCLLGGAITILKNMSSSMGRMTSHILWKTTCSKQSTIYIYICVIYIYLFIYIRAMIDVVCGSCVARHIIHSIIEIWAWPQKPWRKNRFFLPKRRRKQTFNQLGPTYT